MYGSSTACERKRNGSNSIQNGALSGSQNDGCHCLMICLHVLTITRIEKQQKYCSKKFIRFLFCFMFVYIGFGDVFVGVSHRTKWHQHVYGDLDSGPNNDMIAVCICMFPNNEHLQIKLLNFPECKPLRLTSTEFSITKASHSIPLCVWVCVVVVVVGQ